MKLFSDDSEKNENSLLFQCWILKLCFCFNKIVMILFVKSWVIYSHYRHLLKAEVDDAICHVLSWSFFQGWLFVQHKDFIWTKTYLIFVEKNLGCNCGTRIFLIVEIYQCCLVVSGNLCRLTLDFLSSQILDCRDEMIIHCYNSLRKLNINITINMMSIF